MKIYFRIVILALLAFSTTSFAAPKAKTEAELLAIYKADLNAASELFNGLLAKTVSYPKAVQVYRSELIPTAKSLQKELYSVKMDSSRKNLYRKVFAAYESKLFAEANMFEDPSKGNQLTVKIQSYRFQTTLAELSRFGRATTNATQTYEQLSKDFGLAREQGQLLIEAVLSGKMTGFQANLEFRKSVQPQLMNIQSNLKNLRQNTPARQLANIEDSIKVIQLELSIHESFAQLSQTKNKAFQTRMDSLIQQQGNVSQRMIARRD